MQTRRGFLAMSAGAIAAASLRGAAPAGAQALASVPTWQSRYGYALGSRQASNREIAEYVKALAATSDRVRTQTLTGATARGQDIRYAIVSHPDNLARLDEVASTLRRIKRTGVPDAEAIRLTKSLPAIVHLYANVHGNEPSGADALTQLLYDLASRTDQANERRLRELIAVVIPVQNPDGRDASTRVSATAFDLNRDWFAMTQPETPGKIALWSRYPGMLGLDMHEQFLSAPGTFYYPPANDPVHRETPRHALEASDKAYTPAIARAFDAKGYSTSHYGAYDLFFPGYGDVMPAHAWGAAGVLFEMENANAYSEKFDRQFAALDATVTVAAEQREGLLRAWALQWRSQKAAGRRGELGANLRQNPASPDPVAAPDERVYGYAIRTTGSAADVAHLVDRLRAFDIEVHVTTRPVRVRRLRPFGTAAFGTATLGRGTIVIRADQPMRAFVHILLEDDAHAAVPYFYDSSGWSNPALMALQGGAIGEPLQPLIRRPVRKVRTKGGRTVTRAASKVATLKAVDKAADLTRPTRAGAVAHAFALDSAFAQAAAFALLRDGVPVTRVAGEAGGGLPAGAAIVPGSASSALEAVRRRFGVRAVSLAATPAQTIALRRPRIALYTAAGTDAVELLFASSRGFARWQLRTRFGLDVTSLSGPEIEAGALSRGFDALVVPDGIATVIPGGQSVPNVVAAPPGAGLTPVGLANIQAFVTGGGTYLGWRTQGVVLAQSCGLAGDIVTRAAPSDLVIPGLPITIDLHDGTAATRGLARRAYAYNVIDPILDGGGAGRLATYPIGGTLRGLGYTAGLAALAGTTAAARVPVGLGASWLFSFDPAYRGYVEGVQRLLGNILLEAPRVGAASARGAKAGPPPGPVDAGVLRRGAVVPLRWTIVRVAHGDGAALRDAHAAVRAQLPADVELSTTDAGDAELRQVDLDPMSGHTAAWVSVVLDDLARRSVRASFIQA